MYPIPRPNFIHTKLPPLILPRHKDCAPRLRGRHALYSPSPTPSLTQLDTAFPSDPANPIPSALSSQLPHSSTPPSRTLPPSDSKGTKNHIDFGTWTYERFHNHCEELQIINVCFADDPFNFARGDVESAGVIMDSFDEFKRELPVKYLGVPLIFSRLLNKDCKILVEKAKNRIGDWKNKSLSFAGRLQLCNSVISSMHVYWASVLLIPKGIIYDIHQLIRGFLWCNGEFKRGKAKVAWEDICLPKREGGLGLRSLDVFNIELMTTHIWNIVSNNESLWVRWIHTYKLRGRTFWDIPLKSNLSWGWLKLLQIHDIVQPWFWKKIGNRLTTLVWYDIWCAQSLLIRFLSARDITREGFQLQNCLADMISNGGWIWLQSWLLKAPNLGLIPVPNLDPFVPYRKVWLYVRRLADMELVPPILDDIILHLQPMSHKRTTRSIIGRLILAASSYLIWLERNNHLFKMIKRSPEEIRDVIMVTVRLKLISFRFKKTVMVNQLLSHWKMPTNFRLHGS
ncbi:hypothetical protein Tco_0687545 [Tanacetum coccineum]